MRSSRGFFRRIILILLICLITISAGHTGNFTTGLTPAYRLVFPVGDWAKANLGPVGMGGGIEGLFGLSSFEYLSVGLDVGYTAIPSNANLSGFSSDALLSVINYGLGVRGDLPMGDRFSLYARAHASGYYAILSGSSGLSAPGFCWGAGAGMTFLINNRLQAQLGASYEDFPGFFGGISVTLGLTTRLSGGGTRSIPRKDFVPATRPGALPGGGYIDLMDLEVTKVFPVLLKYYEENPFGTVTVTNKSRKTLEDVKIFFVQNEYIATPQPFATFDELPPGEELELGITALFMEEILTITEGAVLAAEIRADYRVDGTANSDAAALTLETFERNAIEWDDDRKIATFITKNDEEVKKYARNVASIVRDEGMKGFSENFQLAVALLGAMDVSGVTYVIDPTSSYKELAAGRAIDAVQYPRQTLQYRAGDCDDMTAAYTAMLEAVAVPTAFITVPGHIYSAFKLDLTPAQAKRTFSRSDDFIYKGEDVWVPVETTALSEGFVSAWSLGARQWREHVDSGKAQLYPTAEAWEVYQPVAFSVSSSTLNEPSADDTAAVFVYELDQYVEQEIGSRERTLLARLNRDPNDVKTLNSLGVLYARYDRPEQAGEYFEEAARRGYAPAVLNMGNLAYLDEDFHGAKRYYEQALATDPDNATAVLGLARAAHALEEFELAESEHSKLAEISPPLAARYGYLAEGEAGITRASDALRLGSVVEWGEQ